MERSIFSCIARSFGDSLFGDVASVAAEVGEDSSVVDENSGDSDGEELGLDGQNMIVMAVEDDNGAHVEDSVEDLPNRCKILFHAPHCCSMSLHPNWG
jgi:hypothetical protein